MNTRNEILSKIRGSLSAGAGNANRDHNLVKKRLTRHKVGVLPYSMIARKKINNCFIEKAKQADASVIRCSQDNVKKNITAFLRKHNLPLSIKTGSDPVLKKLLRDKAGLLEISHGPGEDDDLVGVSQAFGAAAETGTLALVSGPHNPTTLNFLPENHIVIVKEKNILLHQEDLWKIIRRKYGVGNMPRTLNLITGPSRSADIEQTLILGAHGPLRLHILVVRD